MTTPTQTESVSLQNVSTSEPTFTSSTGTTQTWVPTTTTTVAPSTQQYFTAEQLEAARQQEKDKLYGRLTQQDETINSFKTQLASLQAAEDERKKAVKDAAKAAEDAAKRETEAKLSAEELIRVKEAELNAKQEQFSKDMELKLATMQKEQDFLRLQGYIHRRVAEETAANTIIPELVEFIGGNTEEEVEASITKVKEKTANIVQGAMTLSAPQMPTGVSPTGGPSGLDRLNVPREPDANEIASMNMEQYRAYREQKGISGAGNNKGLFA